MGDFEVDTRVERDGQRYAAALSSDWEVWGPNGGYIATIALRAAAAATRFRRPASFAAHYLGVAQFAPVELEVKTLRAAKRAESLRVSMTQGGNAIMEALVWVVDELNGIEHDETRAPEVPGPSALKSWDELAQPSDGPGFKFWDNLESKPTEGYQPWPPPGPLPARVDEWHRFRPRASFDDPFVDAARSLLLIDTLQWPAACRPHAYKQSGFVAPTIDLAVNFHRLRPKSEWLLCSAQGPIAHQGLVGGKASVWSEQGELLASGGGHLMCRPVPPSTPGAA